MKGLRAMVSKKILSFFLISLMANDSEPGQLGPHRLRHLCSSQLKPGSEPIVVVKPLFIIGTYLAIVNVK
jgi:hypothetical protein